MNAKLQIKSFSVSGYGTFRDKEYSSISSNFVLVYGRNEIGKSTLFSFLRGMISGFPSLKKKLENRYLPLNGGTYGGEAKVALNNSELSLVKSGKDLSVIEIEGAGKEELERLIAGLDRDHYRAIFAFDLLELTSLKLLDDASLNERLFSSFFEGSEDLVSGALKDLDKSKQELLRARSKGKIDNLYQKFQEGEARIRTLEYELMERTKKITTLDSLEQNIISRRDALGNIALKIESLKDIKEAEGIIAPLKKEMALREELSKLPTISSEEEVQYRELSSERAILKHELKELESSIQKEKDENISRENKLSRVSVKEIEKFDSVLRLKSNFKIFSVASGLVSSLLVLAYCFSVLGISILSFGIVLLGLLGVAYYSYVNRHYKLGLSSLDDFGTVLGLNPPFRADSLVREFNILQRDFENSKDKLSEMSLKINKFEDRLAVLARHPLGHLLESDFIDLRNNGIKFSECLTRIKTLEEALKSLNLPLNRDVESVGGDLEALGFEHAKISRELDQLLEERGSIKSNLLKLSTSSEIQELRLEVFGIKSEIERLLFSWRVDAVSEYLLREALKRVGESAFKSVSSIASEYFKRITLGAYQSVSLSEKGDTVLVQDKNNRKLEPNQLSQGTVEQLYLSLRLALVKVSKDSIGQLPILLDDVLVNFDTERATEIVRVLKEVSSDNQVFYFTCHDWIRDIYAKEMDGQGSVLSL